MDITKVAFASQLNYPQIVVNEKIVVPAGGSVVVPHNLNKIPNVRVWVELFEGEISYSFLASAVFYYSDEYANAGIDGFFVTIDEENVYIDSFSPTRNVYVRVYR